MIACLLACLYVWLFVCLRVCWLVVVVVCVVVVGSGVLLWLLFVGVTCGVVGCCWCGCCCLW